jgi:hypothetical protein
MRKMLIPVAALVLCAAPLRAQQAATQPEPAPAAQAEEQPAPKAALYPTSDEVRQQVQANEQRLGHQHAPLGSKDWWYLVAAIAIGVIIAAVLL